MNGFYVILKPTGMTSSDVVVKLRGILRARLETLPKVGHFGTLDPGAAGVLPVAVGRAVRLFDYSANGGKCYRAGFRFGIETDTLDSYGAITKRSDVLPNIDEILDVLPKFIGKICQIPPQYSSKFIDGQRAYDLARKGKEAKLEGREIEIFSITFVKMLDDTFVFDIVCSGGTYIRSIVRDMAYALGSVGYMSFLIRTQSGLFDIKNAITFDELEKDIYKPLIPVEFLTDTLPRYDVDKKYSNQVLNGVMLKLYDLPKGYFTVYVDGALLGIGKDIDGILSVGTRLI
ncbi:MAG: tRNA pseudouridine(55) synthase TruB [Clostridia bacterium]